MGNIKSHKYHGKKKPTFLIDDKEYLVCPVCLVIITRQHIHHIIPVFELGKTNKYNCIVLCSRCHRLLHDGTDDEYEKISLIIWDYMVLQYGIYFSKLSGKILKLLYSYYMTDYRLQSTSFLEFSRTLHILLKDQSKINRLKALGRF